MSTEGQPRHEEQLEEAIVGAIRRIARAVDLQSRQLAAHCGLTGPQLVTLRAIRRLQPVSPSTLAREISVGQATVTGILDRLERRGLTRRSRHCADRRKVTVQVTADGDVLLERAPPLLQNHFRVEISRLADWERTQILSTLQRVASLMDSGRVERSPFSSEDHPADGCPRPASGDGEA